MTVPALQVVREIGPFDAQTLPRGLLAEHRLKPGRWGRLTLRSGCVTLVWDDGAGEREMLTAPAEAMIPPERPHHLEPDGDFALTITFLAEEGGG